MKIAILGATSQIAKDLIASFLKREKHSLFLYGRDTQVLGRWIEGIGLRGKSQIHEYKDFGAHRYDAIINFVGVGDPKKVQEIGKDIFEITEKYDNMAINYIKSHRDTKYIFLSSGAVYGGVYQDPADINTMASININNLSAGDWYTAAKLFAEIKHRSLSNLPIVDIRIFNYFSRTQSIDSNFLIVDAVRAIKEGSVLRTSRENVIRDFITPFDFYNFVQAILDFKPKNMVLDCYTKEPVSKFLLLSELKRLFGLKYCTDESVDVIQATGVKENYFSVNKAAKYIGYRPSDTSLNNVINEISVLLNL